VVAALAANRLTRCVHCVRCKSASVSCRHRKHPLNSMFVM
jgi:hypothetical protein